MTVVAWAASATAASAWCVRGVAGWDTLRLRAAPGATAREIGALPPAACGVAIIGACRGAWCPIDWHGQRGWSNAAYLTRGGMLDNFFASLPGLAAAPALPLAYPARSVTARPAMSRPLVRAAVRPPAPRAASAIRRTVQPKAIIAPSLPAVRAAAVVKQPAGPPKAQPAPQPASQFASQPVPQAPVVAIPLAPVASAATVANAQAPLPKSTSPQPLPGSGEVCVVDVAKGETLKVRAGPGADQPLRYGYPSGACGVKLTGPCRDGWCPVDYRNYRGWAEQRYLK